MNRVDIEMTNEGFLEPTQKQITYLRSLEQYQGVVQDTILNEKHPSYFWLVEIGYGDKQKLYWVDMVTYQVYSPESLKVMSGRFLKIKKHPTPAIKKRRTVYKNSRPLITEEE